MWGKDLSDCPEKRKCIDCAKFDDDKACPNLAHKTFQKYECENFEELKGFAWIPKCYKIGENGFCKGIWAKAYGVDYWSYKQCRYCPLFPIETCLNCKHIECHGPHISCDAYPNMTRYLDQKKFAWNTRKVDLGLKKICPKYERP